MPTSLTKRRLARAPRLGHDAILDAARRMFMATGSLEMRALANELGIGRATLYRWKGGREELLSEVLSSLGQANLKRAEADVTTPYGPEHLCDVHDLHLRRICESAPMRTFIRTEPEVASRLLLEGNGRVHIGAIHVLADLIRREEAASGWRAPLGAEVLAGVVSRLSEAFLFSDLIAKTEPDVTAPDVLLRLMFGLPIDRSIRSHFSLRGLPAHDEERSGRIAG